MFKVIDLTMRLPRKVTQAELRAADSRACAQMVVPKRGVPRTNVEWTALVKIASGELDVPPEYCARLVDLGLIERKHGQPALTRHGRFTLGLPD